jgi:predicted nucleotidyltransferase
MRREEVVSKLKELEPALRARGVAALYLFGSVSRDEADSGSDIDLFVDPLSDQQFGFLQFMDAYETIQQAVGRNIEVGYSTRSGLSPYVRDDIEREAFKIF